MALRFPNECLGTARRTKEKYTDRCPLGKRGRSGRAAVCEEVARRPPTPHHLRAICCLFRDAAPLFMPFLRRYPRLIGNPEVQGAADVRGRGWARGRAGGRGGRGGGRVGCEDLLKGALPPKRRIFQHAKSWPVNPGGGDPAGGSGRKRRASLGLVIRLRSSAGREMASGTRGRTSCGNPLFLDLCRGNISFLLLTLSLSLTSYLFGPKSVYLF